MKTAILRRWGTRVGDDIQRIVKPCYGKRGWGENEWSGCVVGCRRCGGTGIYAENFYQLERWRLGGRVFHANPQWIRNPGYSTIAGRIEHANPGSAADEATLWLALITGHWRLLWAETAHVWRYGRGWYPLLNVACLVYFAARLWDRVKLHRCHCGRAWRQWFSEGGWCVCRVCRKSETPIPF